MIAMMEDRFWEPPDHWDWPSPVLAGWTVYYLRVLADIFVRDSEMVMHPEGRVKLAAEVRSVATMIDQVPMADVDLASRAGGFLVVLATELRTGGQIITAEKVEALGNLLPRRAFSRKEKPPPSWAGYGPHP